MPDVFNSAADFEEWFGAPMQAIRCAAAVSPSPVLSGLGSGHLVRGERLELDSSYTVVCTASSCRALAAVGLK
jgi:hypothetical protein